MNFFFFKQTRENRLRAFKKLFVFIESIKKKKFSSEKADIKDSFWERFRDRNVRQGAKNLNKPRAFGAASLARSNYHFTLVSCVLNWLASRRS